MTHYNIGPLELFRFPCHNRPDITVMVDWALKINYLSIYLSVPQKIIKLETNQSACYQAIPLFRHYISDPATTILFYYVGLLTLPQDILYRAIGFIFVYCASSNTETGARAIPLLRHDPALKGQFAAPLPNHACGDTI